MRVLLVEDSAWMIESLVELIRSTALRIDIRIAQTDREAIENVSNYSPDLVFLDLKLKQGNGFGVLRKLVMQDRRPSIVVLTNFALPKYRELALLIGADAFLDKATDTHTVPTMIESIWHSRNRTGNLRPGFSR